MQTNTEKAPLILLKVNSQFLYYTTEACSTTALALSFSSYVMCSSCSCKKLEEKNLSEKRKSMD